MFRDGLRRLLEAESDLKVIGEASEPTKHNFLRNTDGSWSSLDLPKTPLTVESSESVFQLRGLVVPPLSSEALLNDSVRWVPGRYSGHP
jgi:hypothetical protein